MLVVEDINEEKMEGRYCFRKSFKSLCKKYGTPTKISTMNGNALKRELSIFHLKKMVYLPSILMLPV